MQAIENISQSEEDEDLSISNATSEYNYNNIMINATTNASPSEWMASSSTAQAPAWMIEFVEFRQRLFLQTVEPIIVRLLGPVLPASQLEISGYSFHRAVPLQKSLPHHFNDVDGDPFHNITAAGIRNDNNNSILNIPANFSNRANPLLTPGNRRHLGFLPDYVEDASSFRETSMSFATLITLFATMASILLIFLSCFYHNQK